MSSIRNAKHRRQPNTTRDRCTESEWNDVESDAAPVTYFARRGKSLPISDDYQAGDIVAWKLTSGVDHIGIVTNILSDSDHRYLIVHNIGAGARIEDVLFAWTIKGHYRFF